MTNSTTNLAAFLKGRIAEMPVPAPTGSLLASPLFQMILRGDAKLPLDRVEEVATALACDVRYLFCLSLRQFYHEKAACIFEKMFTDPVTDAETIWLNEIRFAADGAEPRSPPSGACFGAI